MANLNSIELCSEEYGSRSDARVKITSSIDRIRAQAECFSVFAGLRRAEFIRQRNRYDRRISARNHPSQPLRSITLSLLHLCMPPHSSFLSYQTLYVCMWSKDMILFAVFAGSSNRVKGMKSLDPN